MWSGGANKLDKPARLLLITGHSMQRSASFYIDFWFSALFTRRFDSQRKFNHTEVSWPTRRLWLESHK